MVILPPVPEVLSMPHGKPRDPRKEEHWRRLVERWRGSGLSVRAFCERHRLAVPPFYAWRRRRQQPARPPPGARPPAAVTSPPVHRRPPSPDERPPFDPISAGARCLPIPRGFDRAALRALLPVLEGPSC